MAAAMRDKKEVDEKMVREVPDLTPPASAPQWEYMTIVGARNADLNRFGAERDYAKRDYDVAGMTAAVEQGKQLLGALSLELGRSDGK